MESDIVLTIPGHWLGERDLSPDELRQALRLGLELLRQQTMEPEDATRVVQVLLGTGRIRHLTVVSMGAEETAPRQPPPTLPGAPISEILIAQRRGEHGEL